MAEWSGEEARLRTRRTVSPVWAVSGPVEESLQTCSSSHCSFAPCSDNHAKTQSPMSLRKYAADVRTILHAENISTDEITKCTLLNGNIPCGWAFGRNP